MKLYRRNKMVVFALLALAIISCDDFLDLKPISEETTAVAYTKASQIEAALTGAYETFQSDAYIWNNVLFTDVRSDNYYAGGDNPEMFEMDYLKITSTNSKVGQSWSNIYNGIQKSNLVMDKIVGVQDPNLTDDRRQQIIGEAYFLRAYHYFSLVKYFGGVPLSMHATESAQPEDVNLYRATLEDTYALIMSDLVKADSLLPDTYGNDASVNKARATAGAANALAAKAAAQQGDFSAALDYIEKVEKSQANYVLLDDYAFLFDGNHYNNAESILEVQYLGSSEGNWAPQMCLPPTISGDTWRKFVTPSHNLIDAYDTAGDVIRKDASVLFETVDWVDEYWGNTAASSIPFAYKWKNAMGWASTDRSYLLRLGDILLLKAEALNETGQQGLALKELNAVRKRVNLGALNITDKEALRLAILNERRLELAQEGHRWDDLARHDLLVSTMTNLVEIDLRTGDPTVYDMTTEKILLPIPQSELDRNSNLTPNPM